ncbi:hypothetical protein [Maribacter sp. Asnod1-A12]|uniref:HEAT repeat domain-containing protein n=1 Tax=Maribacter sp. Asnod1-A12 TaxID=3160576 RepID=UPI00386B9EE2
MNYLNLKIQIRELIKKDFDRKVLTEVLLDLRKDLSGQSQSVLIELYKDLGLHNDAYEKLKSRKWQIVSSGILELTTMEVDEAYSFIIKFINHRQSTIRKQAEIAIVNLKEEGIKYFLDNTKYKIAEWQQLKILDVLRHKSNYNPPQFGLWLTSNNAHVVLFSLRLIKYYSQNDAEKSIITLLKHKNRDIQLEAIECIKDFHFISALPTLKLVYPKANHDIKIAILDAIGELGSKAEIIFLENLKTSERHFNIKGKVIGTLNKINPESVLPTKNISTSDFYDADSEVASLNIEVQLLPEVDFEKINEESLEIAKEKISSNQNIELEKEVEDINESMKLEENENLKKNVSIENNISSHIESSETNRSIDLTDIDLTFLPHINKEPELIENIQMNDANEEINTDETIEEELTFDFIPIVVDEISIYTDNLNFTEEKFEPLFVLDDQLKIEDEESNFSSSSQANINTEMIDIDWSSISTGTENIVKLNGTEDSLIHFDGDVISFSANFMSTAELETMVLLENIAELGDCRELILLTEIISNNSSELVIERANELIRKFSYQSPRPKELFAAENDLSESVFTDIYSQADSETKLILLKEIKNFGNKKEIFLLESIIKSESDSLVKLATEALKQINSQLEIQVESDETNEDILFDDDFELELKESFKKKLESDQNGSTLFDQLCSLSNSLYNKNNG